MTVELLSDRAKRKTAELSWNTLTKRRNYYISPVTDEEYIKVQNEMKLIVNHRWWIFNDTAKKAIRSLADSILYDPAIKTLVSRATVNSPLFDELTKELHNREENSSNKRSFLEVLKRIECSISRKLDEFEFFFPVEGIALEGINQIGHGAVEILHCNQTVLNELVSELSEQIGKHNNNQEDIRQGFEKRFLNRIFIKSVAYGDRTIAQKKAYRQAREFINYLRFAFCILIHERIAEQIIRINLSIEAYSEGESFLLREKRNSEVSYVSGRGQRFLQKLIINEKRLENLTREGYLKDFISITGISSPNELESIITTATYWIGEAQNEFNLDVAFIKYWTALECMFTRRKGDPKGPTEALIEGIPKLIAYSHYKFIKVEDITEARKIVSKLYDKRSDIVHRGMRHIEEEDQGVSYTDISQVCKYAVWSVFCLFELRHLNYATKKQVIHRIEGLYPPSISEDLIDGARRGELDSKSSQVLRCCHLISYRWRSISKV